MTWNVTPERYDTAEATSLRRDYYDEVASRYWQRPATEAEIDEGLKDDDVALLAPPTGTFLVGRHDGEPASCAGLRLVDHETAEVTRVYVRPQARGTGGGAHLLRALEEAAKSYGVRLLRLDTRNDLVEARALYTRHGYEEVPAFNNGQYAEHWYAKKI